MITHGNSTFLHIQCLQTGREILHPPSVAFVVISRTETL